jgi:hypothetical protein
VRRFLLPAAAVLLVVYALSRAPGEPLATSPAEVPAAGSLESPALAPAEASAGEARDEVAAAPAAEASPVPAFFPKARVVARVLDAEDAHGRQRMLETVETSMKEPYVRVERTFQRDARGALHELRNGVAMVANQLLLQRPEATGVAEFERRLRRAGAVDVKELGEATLATFPARPQDPRALDAIMARVREVAGAGVTVEPNYLRRLF